MTPAEEAASILKELGVDATSGELASHSPIDGSEIGRVQVGDAGNARHGRDASLSSSGGRFPHRGAASWSGCSARNCARRRSRWQGW